MISDWTKVGLLVPLFLVFAPMLGVVLRGRPGIQRLAVSLLCFTTIGGFLGPQNWSLTLSASVDLAPRSHTKGFDFFFNTALAIALILARWLEDRRSFRWVPPGLGWYLLYCAASLVSLMNAFLPNYVFMAASKHLLVVSITIAVFNTVRTKSDLVNTVRVLAWMAIWQTLVCIKLKYINGGHQVSGTYPHQNSLGMYTVALGLTLLGVTFAPKGDQGKIPFYGFLGSALVTVMTISRATMATFACGTVLLVAFSLLKGASVRSFAIAGVLTVLGVVGLSMTFDTIAHRFQTGNDNGSSILRDVMIESAKMMVEDHPTGVGWNNYAYAANRPFEYARPYEELTLSNGSRLMPNVQNGMVESHYYLLLSETGYQGLVGWLLVITVGLWRNLKALIAFGYSFRGMLSAGIGVGCLMNYAQGLLERVISQPRNLMLWMVLLAITGRLEIMRREEKRRSRS